MRQIIEKLKALEAVQKDCTPSYSEEIAEIREKLEAMTRPGEQICWVEGIQEHGNCVLTTDHCGFWSGADAVAWLSTLRHEAPDMAYVKLFRIYGKETK